MQDWAQTIGIGSLPFIYSAMNPSRPEPRCHCAGDSLGAAGAGDGKEAGTLVVFGWELGRAVGRR